MLTQARVLTMSLAILLILTIIAAVLLYRKSQQAPSAVQSPVKTGAQGVPSEWPQIQALLDQKALPMIRISLFNEKPVHAHQSKFGGRPWWPAAMPWPRGKSGQPLVFLAQINFSELDGQLADFPSTGLLQFFIASDDLYGMDFIDQTLTLDHYLSMKKNFAVVYHPEFDASTPSAALALAASDEANLPHSGETSISLTLGRDIASPLDYRFRTILSPQGDLSEATEEYAFELLSHSPSHKLGGYAAFTQEDPRGYQAGGEEWLLLFQIDTDSNEHFEIMWGDAGIANFFIRRADLKALDFGKVWYNWDCH